MSIESKGKTERTFVKVVKVLFIWFLLLGIGVGAWKGYKHFTSKKLEKETGSTSQYASEEKVRADAFSGYCILRSPETQSNLLLDGGIKLNFEDDKADYVARMEALRDRKVGMAVFTIDSFIKAGIEIGEFPATIVLVLDKTIGADAVLAYKSAIKSMDDLNRNDAKFVLTPNSPSEFLARIDIAYFDLRNLQKKWIVEADGAEDVYKRLMKASKTEPTAYVLWEPFVSRALKNPDIHVLFSSKEAKDHIVDVLVVERHLLNDKPELVKKIVKAYLSAAYSYRYKMAELVLEDAKLTGERLTKEDANDIVKGIQWKNTRENYAHFGLLDKQETRGLDNLEDIIIKITNILVATGSISKENASKIQPTSLFYNGILRTLKAEDFHPAQKFGIAKTGEKIDEVRGDVELPELTDEQWNSLIPVGQMRIEPISFRTATAELSIQSKRDLDELSSKLSSMPYYYLLVVGHARAEGDIEANKALAEGRAKAAAEYLVLRRGISRNRIRAIPAAPSGKGAEAQSVTFQLVQSPY